MVALGLLVSAASTYVVARKPGVYWAEVQVRFLIPASTANPNTLVATTGGLISFAGAVSRIVEPDAPAAHVVSPDVTLADQGIRYGTSVTLPNDGGQWTNNYDQPALDVQAVASSVGAVTSMMQRLLTKISNTALALQNQAGVLPVNRITVALFPSQPQVFYIVGSRLRATGATLLLALALTAGAGFAARYLLMRRSAARALAS